MGTAQPHDAASTARQLVLGSCLDERGALLRDDELDAVLGRRKELDDDSCCANGSSKKCNVPWRLDKALRRVKALKRKNDGMPGDLEGVRREIDAGRPVCIRIGWSGGGGHFIAIEGYRDDDESVAVEDPWHGTSDVPLAHFRAGRYQGTGRWTHTYYTKKP